jgi:hypothetical protein
MVRDLNDRLYAMLRDLKTPHGDFDCECGNPDCGRSVAFKLPEYAAMRVSGGLGVLSPEHLA